MSEEKKSSSFVEKIFPLPSRENRRSLIVPVKWLQSRFDFDKDSHYLCYLLFVTLIFVGFITSFVMLFDVFLGTNILIDTISYEEDPSNFVSDFFEIAGPITMVLTVLFYLRIRLPMNVKNAVTPVMMGAKMFLSLTRKEAIRDVAFIWFFIFIGFLFVFEYIIKSIVNMYGESDVVFYFIVSIVTQYIFAYSGVLLVSITLSLEKIFRFYKEFFEDVNSYGIVSHLDKHRK